MAWAASRTTDEQDTRCPGRKWNVSVYDGGNLIVWGGSQPSADKGGYSRLPSSDVWFYNAHHDFWTCRQYGGQHPTPTAASSSVLVRPYWYIIGGGTSQCSTDHVYRLHVTSLEWERVKTSSPGLSPRRNLTSWAHDDRIYCYGGYGPDVKSTGLHQYGEFVEYKKSPQKSGYNNQLLVLDVNTQQWSNPPCEGIAPSPRSGHAAAMLEDKVYICGGISSGVAMIDLHCLNLTTMTWSGQLTPKGPVPERRPCHSLTAVGGDRFLLFWGISSGGPPEDLLLLSTAAMEWTRVKEMTGHPRYYHTATCAQSGNVLVFGGREDFDTSRNVPSPFDRNHKQLSVWSMSWLVTILSCFAVASALPLLEAKECSSKVGQNVTLTFYLPEDISKNHEINGFSVLRYPNQVLDDIEPVLDCFWFPPRNLRCLEKNNYVLIEPVTDAVTINIQDYTDERHGGRYLCQANPSQKFYSNKCQLPPHLSDEQTKFSTETQRIYESTGQLESEQQEKFKDSVHPDHSTAELSLLSILLVAVMVHLAVWVLYVWKRRANPPATNDADLQQRLSNMEKDINKIHSSVYQMTTDTTATLLKQLQNLSAKLDNKKSLPREESSSGYKDETFREADEFAPFLN